MARRPFLVLHIISNASGGAAMSTVSLMTALREYGVASAAVCHPVGGREERQAVIEATEGRTVFATLYAWNRKGRAPWPRRAVNDLRLGLRTGWARQSARRVSAFAVETRADLIHTNTILNPEGGLAARRLGLPHVWHLRELVGPDVWFQLPLGGRALGRFLARRCSVLVANSEAAARRVRDGLPEGLLAVVPNGLDDGAFDGPRREPSPPVVVAMVANLGSHVKKHALFVEAAARVSSAEPIEFRVYGAVPEGGYVADLRAQVRRHGLEPRFRFMGHRPDPAAIMREIDILVHPSDLESFGRIAVEAMASRVPVVGVRAGGIEEVVQNGVTGLLAEPGDAADLAIKIERLAADPGARRAMGEAGRSRAIGEYSLRTHVTRMLAVYERAMERPLSR